MLLALSAASTLALAAAVVLAVAWRRAVSREHDLRDMVAVHAPCRLPYDPALEGTVHRCADCGATWQATALTVELDDAAPTGEVATAWQLMSGRRTTVTEHAQEVGSGG